MAMHFLLIKLGIGDFDWILHCLFAFKLLIKSGRLRFSTCAGEFSQISLWLIFEMRLKWYRLLHLKWVWNLLVTVLLLSLLERGVVWYVMGVYSFSNFCTFSNFLLVFYFQLILFRHKFSFLLLFCFQVLIKNLNTNFEFFFNKNVNIFISMKIKRAKSCMYFLYSNSIFCILKLKT